MPPPETVPLAYVIEAAVALPPVILSDWLLTDLGTDLLFPNGDLEPTMADLLEAFVAMLVTARGRRWGQIRSQIKSRPISGAGIGEFFDHAGLMLLSIP